MDVNQLPQVLKEDDLLILLEQFKNGLIARATGKGYDDAEYQKIRKLILSNSKLDKLVPKFLKTCRTLDDFWQWIKTEAQTYGERRTTLATLLNPMLDAMEYETGEAALEFSKNYQEKEIIGTGGFGVVYKYEHRLLQIPFAVKIFAPAFYEGSGNEKELERFFQ
jgi:hypothetical protein